MRNIVQICNISLNVSYTALHRNKFYASEKIIELALFCGIFNAILTYSITTAGNNPVISGSITTTKLSSANIGFYNHRNFTPL